GAASLSATLPVQWTGAGVLDAAAALRANVAIAPVSLSLGAGTGTANLSRPFTVTNLGAADDTFTISIAASSGVAPTLDTNAVRLGANGSQTVNLRLGISDPAVGVSQGYLHIRGTRGDVDAVVPYWYAVSDQAPAEIPVLSSPDSGLAGSLQRITFRVI